MTTFTSRIVAAGGALLLAASLVACGGGEEPKATEPEAAPEAEPVVELSTDAEVQPDVIEAGWQYVDRTSDLWRVADGSSPEQLFFTNAANDAGVDVTFLDEEGTEDSVWDLELVDGHLQTKADATDRRQVDITFQGNFDCYDAVSDTHYVRGDRTQEEYDALFAGRAICDPDDPDRFQVVFGDDGTVTQTMGDKVLEGTYEVVSANIVRCHYPDWDTDYRWDPDTTDNITEVDDGGMSKLVLE